ncbi:MAG: hypothetical protein RPR40_04485 [Bermanella sp.]|jgi:hypothetical protein
MSTSSENTASQGTTVRQTLIETFSDNATPTGDDFREFIESSVIQGDDPITVEAADKVKIDGDLHVTEAVTVGSAKLTGQSVSLGGDAAHLSSQSLKVGDGLTFDDAKGLQIAADLKVASEAIIEGDLSVNGAVTVDGEFNAQQQGRFASELSVKGQVQLDQRLNVGSDDHSGQVKIRQQGADSSLLVQHTNDNNQTSTQLCLDDKGRLSLGLDEGQAEAKLHLYHSGSNNEAILKVDDSANDARPFIIKGDGRVGIATAVPENELDVAGNVRIGRIVSKVSGDNNLSVENSVGVGTASPEARLDVRADVDDTGMLIKHGGEATLTVGRGLVSTDEDTDLTVGGNALVQKTLTVDGESHFMQTLNSKANLVAHEDAQFKGDAKFDSAMNVQGSTALQDMSAAQKATFEQQVTVLGDAKYAQTVGIGLGTDDNHNADAALHIKQTNKPALRVDNLAGKETLLVNDTRVALGSSEAPVTLDVMGSAAIEDTLQVQGAGTFMAGAKVSQQLAVEQAALLTGEDGTVTPALSIQTQVDDSVALKVSHHKGALNKSVLTVREHKVGVLCDTPERDFHVAGQVQVDDDTHLKSNVDIAGELLAHGPVKVDQTLSLGLDENTQNDARLHISPPSTGNSLKVAGSEDATLTIQNDSIGIHNEAPTCALDVMGDVQLTGQTRFNDFLTVAQQTLTLTMLEATEVDGVMKALAPGIQLTPTNLSINVSNPQADFHLKGSAKLEGETQASELTVASEFTVNGVSKFNNQVSVQGPFSINTQQLDTDVDFHLRQSLLNQTALRIDPSQGETPAMVVKSDHESGKLGINTAMPAHELDVQGSARISQALLAQGRLEVSGETTLTGNTYVQSSMGFSVQTPQARLHIDDDGSQEAALRIDSRCNQQDAPLVFKQGMLGLGVHNPKVRLDVKGDACIADEFTVQGRTHLEHTLDVDKDALFKSDFTVHKDSELMGQTVLGQVNDIDPQLNPNAQLYIADTRFKEALRIDSKDYASLVFRQGKLAIGKSDPRVALDVVGELSVSQNVEFEAELEVEGVLKARNNIEGSGSLHIAQKANFGSDVRVRGDLIVEDKTDIEEELTVLGKTELRADLEVKLNTTLEGCLDVSGDVMLMKNAVVAGQLEVSETLKVDRDLHVNGAIHTGVANPQAHFHMQSPPQQTAFILDKKSGKDTVTRLLTVDEEGRLGLGTDTPSQTLEVMGSARISEQLYAASAQVDGTLSSRDLLLNYSLQMSSGPKITSISDDNMLGGDGSLNSVLATQAAVKAYIDNVAVPFGRGGKTYTVSSQRDFDELFNLTDNTSIAQDTTIILLPLNQRGVSEYQLRNTVSLRSGVSIVGFNEFTTRIGKQNPNARFEIIGSANSRLTNIHMSGFCFDGKNLQSSKDGAAFYLEHAANCQLNCRIENHTTWGDGGAIFAPLAGDGRYTVEAIEALKIFNCRALDQGSGADTQLNEGGAAYGLYRSTIHARDCQAERGGAVAKCKECIVEAINCNATRSGGGAYRCEQLRLLAIDCRANLQNGKGGGAYYCSDLMCEGMWSGNNAAEAPHIYASNHLTGESEERHYWKGDYVGRRIDDDVSVWRSHNE